MHAHSLADHRANPCQDLVCLLGRELVEASGHLLRASRQGEKLVLWQAHQPLLHLMVDRELHRRFREAGAMVQVVIPAHKESGELPAKLVADQAARVTLQQPPLLRQRHALQFLVRQFIKPCAVGHPFGLKVRQRALSVPGDKAAHEALQVLEAKIFVVAPKHPLALGRVQAVCEEAHRPPELLIGHRLNPSQQVLRPGLNISALRFYAGMLIHGMRASYGVGTPDPPIEFVIVVAHPLRDVHVVLL